MVTKTFYIIDEISNSDPDVISCSRSFTNWGAAQRHLMARLPYTRCCMVKRYSKLV